MVGKIFQPGTEEPAQASGRLTADSNQGAIEQQVANTRISEGQNVQKVAEEYFNKTNDIFKEGQYSEAMLGAQQEFNQKYNDRLQQIKDSNGNVNIRDIPKDVNQMGQEILSKYTSNILDPEVSMRLNNNFSNLTLNKGIEAVGQAAALQEQYAKKSASDLIENSLYQATKDPTNASTYIATAREANNSLGIHGMSDGELSKKIDETQTQVATDKIIGGIRDGSITSQDISKLTPEQTGLTNAKLLSLQTEATSRESQAIAQEKAVVTKLVTGSEEDVSKGNFYSDDRANLLEDAKNKALSLGDTDSADKIDHLQKGNVIAKTLNQATATQRAEHITSILADPDVSKQTKTQTETIAKNIQTQIDSDPMAFYLKNNPDSNVTPLDPKDPNFSKQLQYRDSIQGRVVDVTGKTGSLATKPEVDSIINTFQSSNTDDKLSMVGNIVQGLGPDATTFLSQFKEKGYDTLPVIGQLVLNGNTKTASDALKGADLRKNDPKAIQVKGDSGTGFYEGIESTQIPVTKPAKIGQDIQAAARDVYYFRTLDSGNNTADTSNDNDIARYSQSINSVMGSVPYSYNTKTILPVPGVSQDNFISWLGTINESDISKTGTPIGYTPEEVSKELQDKTLSLMSSGTGVYSLYKVSPTGVASYLMKPTLPGQPPKPFLLDYTLINKNRVAK